MGYGITHEELHSFAQHKEKVKIVSVASLDPKCACQANSNTQDAMFLKLNSYIEMLYSMGKIPWSTYENSLRFNLQYGWAGEWHNQA